MTDCLSINGEDVNLQGCLALPWNDPRLIEMSEEEALERSRSLAIGCSFCWRQYIASWKFVDDCLFLADIDGIYRWDGRLTVFAHWVTDILRIAEGDLPRARLDNLPSEDTVTPGLSLARRWSLRDLLGE